MASAGGGGSGADVGLAFLRLAGLGLASHGWTKVVGGEVQVGRVEGMGFPLPLLFAWAAALSELIGGFLVAIGLFARVGAAFAAITMFVAAFLYHASDPFAERELVLLYLVAMLAIALLGAGKWSVDGLLRKKS